MSNGNVKTMRDAFIESIHEMMCGSDKIFFLVADFGAPALDKIRRDFPDRFINVGIAEQNLVNVAAGLALEGYDVIAYAISPFLTMRPYEQIRVNLSLSSQIRSLNVNLVGVGGGVSYEVSGPTHHCLEDVSIMRLLPNMTVLVPCDPVSAGAMAAYAMNVKSPKYLRFDGKPLPAIYENFTQTDIERGFTQIQSGQRTCIVSNGFMTHRALRAASSFGNTAVIDFFTLKPFNEELFFDTICEYDHIVTIEEAFTGCGGLDSIVTGLINKKRAAIHVTALGFKDRYTFEPCKRDVLHKLNSIDDDSILKVLSQL